MLCAGSGGSWPRCALVQALELLDVRKPRAQRRGPVRKHRELRVQHRGTITIGDSSNILIHAGAVPAPNVEQPMSRAEPRAVLESCSYLVREDDIGISVVRTTRLQFADDLSARGQ